jgi:hypothetical protein
MELKIQDLKAYVEFIKSQTPDGLFIVGGTGRRAYCEEVDIAEVIRSVNPTSIISGMADGWDIALAKTSLSLNIPLAAAIPFHGFREHEKKGEYQDILNNALTSAYYICSEGYEVWKLHQRNEWIADRANLMLAFWDGNKKGETFNCIEYCHKKNIPWINLYTPPKELIDWDKIKVGVDVEKIVIGNLKNLSPKLGYIDVICDRSSVLGNPYLLEREEDREMCVEVFSTWLDMNFQAYKREDLRDKKLDPALVVPGLKIAEKYKRPTVAEIMMNIVNLAGMLDNGQKIRLLCHCEPKLCHTTVIKNRLLEIVK